MEVINKKGANFIRALPVQHNCRPTVFFRQGRTGKAEKLRIRICVL
jgi:hypothetical protein